MARHHQPQPPTTTEPGCMFDADTAARRLGCPRKHIYRLVEARRIPHYRFGRIIRFDPEEFEEWRQASHVVADLI